MRRGGDGHTARCFFHPTLLSPRRVQRRAKTRALRRIWHVSMRSGNGCGARRDCRAFCTSVQNITDQTALQRRRIGAQLPSIVYYGCMSFGAAARPSMRCTFAGAHEQHSALWLSSSRAALRRGPRAAPTRNWMHVRRVTPAALVRSVRGCKRTRDQPPCHSSSSTYRAQLGARDRPRTSIAPRIAGTRKNGGENGSARRNTSKRLRSSNSVVVSAR